MTALVVSGVLITYDRVAVTDTKNRYDTDGPSDDELRRRLEELEEKKSVLSASLKRMRQRINNMQHEIKRFNADAEREAVELMFKIQELQDLIRRQTQELAKSNPDDLDEEFAEFDREHSADGDFSNGFHRQKEHYRSRDTHRSDDEDSDEEDKPESQELKKLFQRIAQRTHPDRTDDPEKHLLFLSAKECRKNHDLQGLKEIWAILQNETSALLNKLLKQVEEERQAVYELQRQHDFIRGSFDYQILQTFELDKMAVLVITRKNLEERKIQLRAHLMMLQRLTGTVPQEPKFLNIMFG